MIIYKVSYVVEGGSHPGGIINLDVKPEKGNLLLVGEDKLLVQEVEELIPPKGDFHYLHITCKSFNE